MAEKRGETEKLKYDFDTTAVCEVRFKDNGEWFRTTAKDFRSFDGPRRLTFPNSQPVLGMTDIKEVKFKTIEYYGPVFMYSTNLEVPWTDSRQTVTNPKLNHKKRTRI